MSDLLSRQLGDLRRRFDATDERKPDGSIVVTIPRFPVPAGWDRSSTAIRFVIPVGFPLANPDSFWTDSTLRLASGGLPMNTALQEPWPGEGPFLWFSWHPSHWDPQRDSLLSYVGIIAKRLSEAK